MLHVERRAGSVGGQLGGGSGREAAIRQGARSVAESRSGAANCCDAALNQPTTDTAGLTAVEDGSTEFDADVSLEVGQRLRTVRQAKGLSLAEVEARSGGRWSASAVGSYERGFRNLSLPRLKALADFFEVTPAALLGDEGETEVPSGSGLVFDIEALRTRFAEAPITRFVEAIIRQRGDFNGRMLSVRRDDIQAVLAMVDPDPAAAMAQLRSKGVLIASDGERNGSGNSMTGAGPDSERRRPNS